MSEDLKKLALAANAAHQGIPWHDANSLIALGVDDDCDAVYIEAASPDAILKLIAERDALHEAMTNIVKSWDARSFTKEELKPGDEMGGQYWSPSASMVDSSSIAKARAALALVGDQT